MLAMSRETAAARRRAALWAERTPAAVAMHGPVRDGYDVTFPRRSMTAEKAAALYQELEPFLRCWECDGDLRVVWDPTEAHPGTALRRPTFDQFLRYYNLEPIFDV